MAEIQAQIKDELRKVAANKRIEETERNKIAKKLEKRLDELKKAQDEQRLISEKIEAYERKIIVGGENLLEKAEAQARLLEESERILENQKQKKKVIEQKLTEKEEEKLLLDEKYANLNEEAQSKTRKLKKLKTMILQTQSEVSDIKTEHQRAMESLLEIVRDMSKELKLNMAILDSYIPQEFQETIEENVIWNEELGEWQLKCVAYTGNNMRKPKEKEVDKNTYRVVDFNHVYLSYTAEGAEKAIRDFQRAKSAKEKKKKNAKNKS